MAGTQRQGSSGRHGVDGIQHQVLQRPVDQLGIGLDHGKLGIKFDLRRDRRAVGGGELRLQQLEDVLRQLVQPHRLELGRGHAGEVAEALDDGAQVGDLRQECPGTLAKHFLELCRVLFFGAQQVFHRNLQRKQRVLQLVCKPPCQLAPCRHPFRLHQAFALVGQLVRHQIERGCQFAELIVRRDRDPGPPVSGGDLAGDIGELLDRTRGLRCRPSTEHETQQHSGRAYQHRYEANVLLHLDHVAARTAHQQHAQQLRVASLQRNSIDSLGARGISRPPHHLRALLALLLDLLHHGRQLLSMRDRPGCIGERLRRECRFRA